jgi:polysaccharide deacetylase 2 family uncharacterized protein YibQ
VTLSPSSVFSFRFILTLVVLSSSLTHGASGKEALANFQPLIAVIIDDLGEQRVLGERAIALPEAVSCAVIPHTTYGTYLAELAAAAGHEVLLHLPMQSVEQAEYSSADEINLDTNRSHLTSILDGDLAEIPHVVGINNHMGSLITRHPGHMEWLMDELNNRGDLFFIDSYTTASSIAFEVAVEKGVPAARRDVFLDNELTLANVAWEFERLKQEARLQGFAIAIGHPNEVTLGFLEQALPELANEGFRLVHVSEIVEMQKHYPVLSPVEARMMSFSGPDKR